MMDNSAARGIPDYSVGSTPMVKKFTPLFLGKRLTFPFFALLALLAVGTLSLLASGLVQAQEAGPIMYPENDMGTVATLTAVDPEGKSIVWSLDDDDSNAPDDGLFDIENGVLTFKSSPDFEDPQGGDGNNSNTYVVTVEASDGGDDTTAAETLTIEVTNVEEPGTVMLSTLQPQVGVAITATLTDPDTIEGDDLTSVSWQWYRGNSEIVGATTGAGTRMSSYTPTTGDIGSVLRAVAMYDDGEDEDKTAQEDSAHAVRQAPESNIPPTFPDQDLDTGGVQTAQTRTVAENTPAGTNLGAPVVASDPDVLTYSLDDTGAVSFDINRATGQLMTKVALNFEGSPPDTVTVTATDPFGAMATSVVTITVTDVNEDPTVTGDASIDHAESNAEQVAALNADPLVYTGSDVDADDQAADLDWDLSGADAGKFELTGTGVTRTLAFEANPDYESPGDSGGDNVYEVTLVVTDSKGNSDEQDVTVKVTNIEEDGVVTLSTLQPRVGFPVTATLADPDNVTADSVSWQWYDGAIVSGDLTQNAIEDATSDTYTPVMGDINVTLTARASYTDGNANTDDAEDAATGEAANSVLADTRNEAPVFLDLDTETEGRQTAQERTIAENTESGMPIGDPVAATDEDDNLTYALGGPDAASFDIVRTSGQLQTKAELDTESEDTYTVTVTAADSHSESSTITVTIKVTNVDEMPDLEGEAPEEYAENGMGAVATFTAEDPEGESITWTLAGDDMEAFSIDGGVLRFKSSPDYEDSGNTDRMYTVTVQASDGGAPTTKEVTIAITNVEEPGTVTLSTLQPQVGRVIIATLDDPDDEDVNTITWQWYRGSSPITGETDGANSVTSTYEPTTGDIGSRLRARAMYDDDEGEDKTAQEDSAHSVRRAPETNTDPVFPDQDLSQGGVQTAQTREVAENTPAGRNIGARVAATDSGDVLTYSLDTGTDAAAFDINRATGQLTTKAALDHEGDDEYTVTVTATDPFGAPVTSAVTITVTDVNEDPSVSGAASIDHVEDGTVLDIDAENDGADPAVYTATDEDEADNAATGLTWTLSGADAGKFDITTTGVARTLSFENAPDFESPGDSGRNNVYEVTVKVTDSKGNSDEQDVTVKVTNVEEDGTVTLSTLQPRVDFPVTATLADADNITAGSVSWQWYKGSVTQGQLDTLDMSECVDATSNDCFIKGAASDTYTPVAFDVVNTLVAVALYTDGSPNEADAPKDFAMMATANTVLADTRNKAPVFPDQDIEMDGEQTDQKRSVEENTESGQSIGPPVAATDSIIDVDTGEGSPEILTYSLGGDDADSFDIVRSSGQLQTKAALDKETKDTYVVMVTATDPSNETATVTVTITVTDDDEAPEIMVGGLAISGLARVDYAEDRRDAVETYTASGPDADMATWTLEGDDAGDFDISNAGVLTFVRASDYENPADANTDNTYMVTVKADDGTYMNTRDVMVMVTNEDDPGRVTFWRDGADATTAAILVGDELGGAVDDSDGNPNDTFPIAMYTRIDAANVTSWQWAKTMTPDMMDSWMNITGATGAAYTVVDADDGYNLRATAMYSDGEGMDKMASEKTMMVTMNASPMFESATTTREVAENTMAGEDIGAPVEATDADNDVLTYALSGTDAASFDIGTTTGQLQTKADLDYETKASYMVTVTATDPSGLTATVNVAIAVTDVVDEMVTGDDLVDRYDADKSGMIEKSEVLKAINDYLFGEGDEAISKTDVLRLINLYLFG